MNKATYKINMPVGWIQLTGIQNRIHITKEGPSIQVIDIRQIPKENAFKSLKIKLEDEVLVSELAEYYVADYKTRNQGFQVNHLETLPIMIDKKQGFKVIFEFTNNEGLVYTVIAYGLLHKEHFYTLYFHAPKLHYFERDLPTFKTVVDSFVLM